MRPSKKANPKASGPFVRRRQFIENQKMQIHLAPVVLDHLRDHGFSDERELKVEFFFYSKTQANADALAHELRELNYEVEIGKSAGNKKLFLINGWTVKMKMDDKTVQHWAEEMCELGFKFDSNFDGWGTTPDQD